VFFAKAFPYRLVAGLLGLLAAGVSVLGQEPTRDPRITELEKEIAALQKKLAELKQAPAAPTTRVSMYGGLSSDWISNLSWRCIGPAGMGGRITAFAVFEADPSTYWVATASGGLLKTTNSGITFEHQFDREATVSVGDVCVAPSDRSIVWVGTGENNPRNSVSWGDGVYKSTDGGKSWKNMGLKQSFQIGRVVVHPKDPNTVYVGALGRLYGPNEERGLFKTTDGGQTWQKIHYLDDKTGVIDIALNPADPETLYIATWERQRDEFDSHRGEPPVADGYDPYDPIKKWGQGSGIFKTTDGGKTFKKLTKGLPTNPLGRIGLDVYRKNPNVVFAIIDCEKIGMGTPPSRVYLGVQGEDATGGAKLTQITENSPAAKAGLKAEDLVVAVDKAEIKSYEPLVDRISAGKAGDKLTLKVRRGKEDKEIVVTLEDRPPDPREQMMQQMAQSRVSFGFMGQSQEDQKGLRVTQVTPNSAAAKAGIQAGDVVMAVDQNKVLSMQQLTQAVRNKKPGEKVTLTVVRDNKTSDVALTLEARPPGRAPGGVQSASATRPNSFWYGGQRENVQERQGPNSHEYGGLFKSTDGGESWVRVNSINPRPMYFSCVRVDPNDEKVIFVMGISMYRSLDGGKTFRTDVNRGLHPDQHTFWIDPRDGRHVLVGCDGGYYVSYDRGDHWDHLNHMAIGQFYHVAVDSRKPYRVFGGLQDNASWGGPSHTLNGSGPINEDWLFIQGGDGFVCRVDPNDPDLVYAESQDGNIIRRNLRTGERGFIRPQDNPQQPRYRFNWNTPFILSNHNPAIFYSAGNYVFRSVKRGDDLKPISPEISRTGRGTGSALAESPRNPDVLWVGTDDGNLWLSRDGGRQWTNLADKVGLPGPRWVATVEPSHHVEGRCYVAFDGHRSNDDEPYLYVTEDFGQTWKPLRANLPTGSSRCLREDLENPDLLFAGTEFAAWVSIDRGASWSKLNNNLPTVAVHEFAIHPTAGEMVAATHGRSLWVLDITPLRQMKPEVVKAKARLFRPNVATLWHSEPGRMSPYGNGSRRFVGQNPPRGAQIYYALNKKAEKATLKVVDYNGNTVRELEVKKEPGFHRVTWDLTRPRERPAGGRGRGTGGPGGGGGPPQGGAFNPEGMMPPAGRAGFQFPGQPVAPGMYRLVLTVDGEELSESVRVEADTTGGGTILASEEDEDEDEGEAERPRKLWIDD
jgi:photosystem II stability/assembly factor-like uncharacterized protein